MPPGALELHLQMILFEDEKRPTENVSFTPLQTLAVPWEILVDFSPPFWKPLLSLPYWVLSNLTGLSNRWKQEKWGKINKMEK